MESKDLPNIEERIMMIILLTLTYKESDTYAMIIVIMIPARVST